MLTKLQHHLPIQIIIYIPDVGSLFANHIIGITCIVGILPLSLFKMIGGGAKKFYEKLEDSLKGIKLPPKDEVLKNVKHLAENFMDSQKLNKQIRENVGCKVGQMISNTDICF